MWVDRPLDNMIEPGMAVSFALRKISSFLAHRDGQRSCPQSLHASFPGWMYRKVYVILVGCASSSHMDIQPTLAALDTAVVHSPRLIFHRDKGTDTSFHDRRTA